MTWHPQGNGQTEAFNKPLVAMLSMYVQEHHKDWKKYLPYIAFTYNTSVNKTTKFSPFYLVYGREPRFPLELATEGAEFEAPGGFATIAEELEH